MKIDMWYEDSYKDATRIDVTFYPSDCTYRGNIYIGDKCVGDYISNDSIELENTFSQLKFKW